MTSGTKQALFIVEEKIMRTNRTKPFVTCLAAAAVATAISTPAWAQDRLRGTQGSDRGRSESQGRIESSRSSSAPNKQTGTISSGQRSGTSSVNSPSNSQKVGAARGTRSNREAFTVDNDWSHNNHHDGNHHDGHSGSNFGIGFSLGPISAYYGPWYSYSGPWHSFYGPAYGYYGPWSGDYAYEWPYYYGETQVSSAYLDPDSPAATSQLAAPPPRMQRATTPEGRDFQRRAEEAFRRGQYDQAVRWANHAVVEMPQDGRMFEFLSQALFAVGDYGAAAGAAHQGIAMQDDAAWGGIVKDFGRFYGNPNDYTEQLRRLEKFANQHAEAPYARFLLGYQYGFLGYPTEGRRELEKAVSLESRDEIAQRLLEQFGGTAPRTKATEDGKDRRPRDIRESDDDARRRSEKLGQEERRAERDEPKPERDRSPESLPE